MSAVSYAYPRCVGTANSVTTPNNTSHTVTLQNPTTGPLVSGQLLLAFVAVDGNPTVTWPSGWTQIFNATNSTAVRFQVYYRVADGLTDGTTITLTTSASEELSATVLQIESHGSTAHPPEVTSAATGNSTAPDSTSLSPTGGSNDYMYLTAFGADGPNFAASPFPASNYPFGVNQRSSSGADACICCVTKRVVTASSENPGAMAIASADEWVAVTVAVYPGTEGSLTLPQITDVVTTATSGTSHVFTLPTYSVGDLLIAAAGFNDTPTLTWPAGWTTLCADTSGSANVRGGVRYRIADGTEGSTMTVTTSVSKEGTGVISAWTGHDPANPPTGSITSGGSQNATSPNLLIGSIADRAWYGGAFADTACLLTEFQNIIQEPVASLQSSAGANACTQYAAFKNRHADNQTISTLRWSASTQWVAWVAVIYPGTIVVPPGTGTPGRDRAHPHFLRPNVHYLPRIHTKA